MSYKIFACDLDGTLLDDNSNVSKDNFDAIEQMTKTVLNLHFAQAGLSMKYLSLYVIFKA